MRLPDFRTGRRGAVGAAAVLLVVSALPAAASTAEPTGRSAELTAPTAVTLPTGDRVILSPAGKGGPPHALQPAARDGAAVGFAISRLGSDLYVIPSDVEAQVRTPRQREAYNVTALAHPEQLTTPSDVAIGSPDGAEYHLTVQILDTDGVPWAGGAAEIFSTQSFTRGFFPYEPLDASGRVTVQVPTGFFSVSARVPVPGGGTAVVADPTVRVVGDTTVVLDARKAQPVNAAIDGVDTTLTQVEVAYGISDEEGRGNLYFLRATPADIAAGRIRVQPTVESPRGEFALTSHWRRQAGPTGELYDLVFESTAIPDPPRYVQQPDDRDLARFDVTYQAPGEATVLPTARVWYTERTGTALIALHPLATPTQRTELATASPTVTWYACVYPDRQTETRVCEDPGPYEPGRHDARWLDLLHPALDQVLRLDDTNLWIFAGLADGEHTGALAYESLEQARFTVRRNGEELWTGPGTFGYVTVPSGRGRFAVEYDVALTDEAVPTAHVSQTRWRFRSGSPNDPTGAEPTILSVGYWPKVDELGLAAADRKLPITVNVRNDGDESGYPVIEKARSYFSTDGGETWHRRRLVPAAGEGAYELVVPASYVQAGGTVSLQVRLVSADHTAVKQRLIDAIDVAS